MHQSANGVFGLKPDAGGTRECIGYERWVADLHELDRDLAIGEPVALCASKLRGHARLSRATWPQYGQKTGVRHQAAQLAHFLLAADEAGKPQRGPSWSAHDPNSGPEIAFRRIRTTIRTQSLDWPSNRRNSETVEGLDHIRRCRMRPSSKSVHQGEPNLSWSHGTSAMSYS